MSTPEKSVPSYTRKGTLVFCVLGALAITFTFGQFIYEKSQHVHTPIKQATASSGSASSMPSMPPVNPSQGSAATGQLPENIPAAMLQAMQEKGISLEDLQSEESSQFPAEMLQAMDAANAQSPPVSPASSGMGNGQMPEAMMQAMQKQKQDGQASMPSSAPSTSSASAASSPACASELNLTPAQEAEVIKGAIAHFDGHSTSEEKADLKTHLEQIALNPADTHALMTIAELFLAHNEYKGVQIMLQRAEGFEPQNSDIAYLQGVVLSKQKDYGCALTKWQKAVQLDNNARNNYAIAMIYRYQFNNEAEAMKYLNIAHSKPNTDSALHEHIEAELKK